MEQKALQIGAVAVTLALLLRLAATWEWNKQEVAETLLFFGTGRLAAETVPTETEAATEVPAETAAEKTVPVFGEDALSLVQVNGREVDTLALLQEPLQWDLRGEQPTVLILHTHASESYEKQTDYTETVPYRTLDKRYNMVSIGARVGELLEAGGIRVIHDETIHDYPSYNDAYENSRQAVEAYLAENPEIVFCTDLANSRNNP